ncbi:MAG: MFS transporter [Tetragenococcus halophilus]|nr:MFS transporter [Tetragenococcus halophilus]
MAAGLAPAYESMAQNYGRTLHESSYFTSSQICALGVFPFLWIPLMNVYGRRSFLKFSAFACCFLNIGGGFCTTYEQQMATRVLVSFFISTAPAAGSSIVSDLSFSHERGKKNGWWSLGLILGTPSGPFFMGFVEYHVGTKWIYFTFAIMNFLQFVLWMFAQETVYVRNNNNSSLRSRKKKGIKGWLGIYKQTDKVLDWKSFFRPLKQAFKFNVSMSVIAASVTYCYANVVLVVEMPQIFGKLFHLNAQQLSLHYISLMLGTIIGEILAGPLSDWWMKVAYKKRGGTKVIVDRLWVSYNGFLAVIVGLIVWGVYLNKSEEGKWNISPLIGAAVAAAGNNIVATVLIAFAIDSSPEFSSDIGLYINLIRHVFGFLGPFYFPAMFEVLNFAGAAGLMVGLVFLFGVLVMGLVHVVGLKK